MSPSRNEQDPADPDRLVAPVADELSGVIDGAIEYRRHGTQSWITLETTLDAGALVARVDSNDLEAGVGYEFRAQATDAAGNSAVTNLRADGSEMSVTGPFRRPAAISEFTINGKNRARIGYGRRALVSGRLLDASRKPIANAPVELEQSYDPGSTHRTDSIEASTDAAGRFRAKLPKGPSRTVKAQFAGDLQRLGASSESRRLRVRGKISLKAPRRVRAGGRATFSGRVKAAGATFSRGGKAVEVQVRIGSRWKTVGQIPADRSTGPLQAEVQVRRELHAADPVPVSRPLRSGSEDGPTCHRCRRGDGSWSDPDRAGGLGADCL